MVLEEEIIEILLTMTVEQALLLLEIDFKIKTTRAIHLLEEQILRTLAAKTTTTQEPIHQAHEMM